MPSQGLVGGAAHRRTMADPGNRYGGEVAVEMLFGTESVRAQDLALE